MTGWRTIFIVAVFVTALTNWCAAEDKPTETVLAIKDTLSITKSNYESPRTAVITDEKGWTDFCRKAAPEKPPKINFATEEIVLVAGGRFSTAGYSMEISVVVKKGEKIQVKYLLIPPLPGEAVETISTTPLAAVVIGKEQGTVEFIDRQAEIATLIEKLGNDDWEVRENASAALLQIGKATVPALLPAAHSDDPEVRMRTRFILSEIIPPILAGQSGWVGVHISEIPSGDNRINNHIKEGVGIIIAEMILGQPAEKYGLKVGDIIISVNKEGFASLDDWTKRIRSTLPGTRITLGLVREGVKQDVEVVLGKRPKEQYEPGIIQKTWDDWAQKYLGDSPR